MYKFRFSKPSSSEGDYSNFSNPTKWLHVTLVQFSLLILVEYNSTTLFGGGRLGCKTVSHENTLWKVETDI